MPKTLVPSAHTSHWIGLTLDGGRKQNTTISTLGTGTYVSKPYPHVL